TGGTAVSCSSSGGTRLKYDKLNRLCWVLSGSSSTPCNSPPTGSFAYSYDHAGNLTTRTYPDNTPISYTYDSDNRLCNVVFSTSPPTTCSSSATIYIDYSGLLSAASPKIAKTFPNGKTTSTFDNAGRLENLVNKYGSP